MSKDRTFNLQGFDNLDPVARTFILICFALAYPAWDLGFELGVHGRVFFEKIFFVWSIATALMLALLVNPRTRRSVPRIAWVATGFPSAWILLALVAHASPEDPALRYLLFWSGVITYVICLPYTVYMLVAILYPDMLNAGKRMPKLVLVFFLAFGLAGYIAGRNHPILLTCEDFEISGEYVPENCRPARD